MIDMIDMIDIIDIIDMIDRYDRQMFKETACLQLLLLFISSIVCC